jgi:hypothetical protein
MGIGRTRDVFPAPALAYDGDPGPRTERQRLLQIRHLRYLEHALDCSILEHATRLDGKLIAMSVDALIARPDCATKTPTGLPTSQPIKAHPCESRLCGSKSCQPADQHPSSPEGRRDLTEHSRVRHCEPANRSDQGATKATRSTTRARHPGRRVCEGCNPQGRDQTPPDRGCDPSISNQ